MACVSLLRVNVVPLFAAKFDRYTAQSNAIVNLDELATSFKARSAVPEVQRLGALLLQWKNDDSNVKELTRRVEHYLGHTRINDRATFDEVEQAWKTFQEDAIDTIGGMTLNERLYWFGLFSRFDGDKDEQAKVYSKLLAKP